MEIIFTREDLPEWEVRIRSHYVPRPGDLVKVEDLVWRVDETLWSLIPGFNFTQVEVQLIPLYAGTNKV